MNILKYLFFSTLIIFAFSNQSFSQRLNLDSSFSGGVSDAPAAVFISATQADGKILVGGDFSFANGVKKPFLARLNSDGTIDQTFNAAGSGPDDTVYEIKILTSGKILIVGAFKTYNNIQKGGLARLNADGSLDAAFNPGGAGASGTVRDLAVQADGNILIGGIFDSYNSAARNSLLRLTVSSQSRTKFDFDGDGLADISVFRPSNSVWYLNQTTAGFSAVQFGISTDKLAPADFDGDGKTDAAVFRNGVWYQLSSTSGVQIIQFGITDDKPTPNAFIR